jgi:GTP-binding protein YchF
MKVGLIGLPQSGKTTLYNALTRSTAATTPFGGYSEQVNLATIPVPDERFDFAVSTCNPKKQTPAAIEITDGGARIQLDENRQKFGTDFFAGVRNMDALVLVVRAFQSDLAPDPPNPRKDAESVLEELLLADLSVIEGRLERLEKARLQKRQSPGEAAEQQTLIRIKEHLEALNPVRTLEMSADEERSIRSFAFVSGKPLILVENLSESDLSDRSDRSSGLKEYAAKNHLLLIELCAKVEMEVAQMEPEEEKEFLEAMGIEEPARNRLIRAAYDALGYNSFFTVGEDEVRAWTLRKGGTALQAAERIHTDIARTFIRAEVIAFDDFRTAGGWDSAKAAGKMRLEGKEYIVKDGDIVHIRNSKG